MKASSVGFISGARRILLVVAAVLLVSQLTACGSLHLAAGRGDINKVRSKLDNGADVNATFFGFTGLTALHEAARKGHIELVRLLIERGADVNAKELGRDTPLLLAIRGNHTETTILLIESGANIHVKNRFGTPLGIVAVRGNTKLVRLLIERGADIYAKDKHGQTALDMARSRNQGATATLIQEAMNRQKDIKTTTAAAPVVPVAPAIQTTPKVTSIVDTPPTTRMPVNPNAYAVVIGIEKYRERLPDAPYAKSDAETMAKYLTESMGFEKRNVAVLINDRATKSDLSKYLGTWLKNRARKPGSRVFVYYSGHGAPDVKTNSAYIVPYDGDPTYIADTGYPLKKLYEDLGKLKAGEIIVALDSCFSGAGSRSVIAKGARPIALALKNPALAAGNIVVLSASTGAQASSTYEAKGHGLFTYYLLKGLQGAADANGSGKISVKELHEYIGPKVETIAIEEYNNEQTPQMMDPSGLSSEMVLIGK